MRIYDVGASESMASFEYRQRQRIRQQLQRTLFKDGSQWVLTIKGVKPAQIRLESEPVWLAADKENH